MNNILVFAAHPDDELLGLGATIKLLTRRGATANTIILGEGLTSRKEKRNYTSNKDLDMLKNSTLAAAKIIGYSNVHFCDLPDNRFDSIDLLDIIKLVSKYVEKYKPDTIFTHHYGDLNIDHRITFNAVETACRPIDKNYINNIILFETPSSTEWNFKYGDSAFRPNLFFDISNTIQYKLEAMKYYTTESAAFPHPRSNEALKTIAKRWGSVVNKNYAEAFEVLRSIIDEDNLYI